MPKVTLRHSKESFSSLWRRFSRAVDKAEILQEVRDREFYEKPSEIRKRRKAAAIKRYKRELVERNAPPNYDLMEDET